MIPTDELLGNLQKNIKDLDLLITSFMEMESIPPSLLRLFDAKIAEISRQNTSLHELSASIPTITTPKEVLEDKVDEDHYSPNRVFEQASIKSIKDSISINDRFLFQRELFSDDAELYHSVISQIDTMNSFQDTLIHINRQFNWDQEDEIYQRFVELVQRKFN